ncbi:LOW QUALITY PROTEIN: uncharacterized protein LOC128930627 [Callithrix jacchus]|uniref:LOW QUALITY PROTEIN: spermatid nuclear transition protein 3 n=1 Tax=Callithrix jacchus TaxID=9483 RepID=UPI0023DD3A2D|nr:LOW QUALITY PROTEIN: spermatid nuclear transition protein 3 [Callithrix jacchus]
MAKVTRKLKGCSKVVEQPNSSTKKLISSKKGKKRKNSSHPGARNGGKVRKIQRAIKRLLHGSSGKKSSSTITEIPEKVKSEKSQEVLATSKD